MLLFTVTSILPKATTATPQAFIVKVSPRVPFYSQFADITSVSWQKVGCGIASLAMIVDYYKPAVSADVLLKQALAAHAYLRGPGWTYKGLLSVGKKHGLVGKSFDLGGKTSKKAFLQLQEALREGPVIASVHYKFQPKNPIPHLVVLNGIEGDTIIYNDPAASSGARRISTEAFLLAWKKRYIVMRPAPLFAKSVALVK